MSERVPGKPHEDPACPCHACAEHGRSTACEKTIQEFLADCSNEYTREQHGADRARIIARICAKHGITEREIPELIRTHNYTHDAEDIEDDYIALAAWSSVTGWPVHDGFLTVVNHAPDCAIRTTRDGWDADCSCKRGQS